MEVNEKTSLEFELGGVEHTIPELLTNRLSENEAVEFVSYKVDHPIVGKPRIIVKTKGKDALELTLSAIEDIRKDVEDFKKALKKSK
jgi:DNA-directed RNA polymerase subunit L